MVDSPLIVAILVAAMTWLSAALISKVAKPTVSDDRLASIDGLRGFLAVFVMIHHASYWQNYVASGLWIRPSSNLFWQLGKGSVALFFMITGLLFFGKVIRQSSIPINWVQYFKGRVFRLTPMYLCMLSIVAIIVLVVSNLQLLESPEKVAIELSIWGTFTVFGRPPINTIDANLITAGVTWTLAYEWLFYLSLPLFSAVVGKCPSMRVLLFCTPISIVLLIIIRPASFYLLAFLVGMASAVLCTSTVFQTIARSSLAVIAFFLFALLLATDIGTQNSTVKLALLSAMFFIVAGGNTMYGILTAKTSRLVGEISYSIYLMHGVAMFVLFKFLIASHRWKNLGFYEFWFAITIMTPLLVLFCFATCRLIEKPAMGIVSARRRSPPKSDTSR